MKTFFKSSLLVAGSLAALAMAAGPALSQESQPAQPPGAPPPAIPDPPPSEPLQSRQLVDIPNEDPVAPNTGNQVYGQAFFAQYSLSNAEDMLRRIPGVSQILDSTGQNNQGRGLGASGDQILINGRRMASKSTDVLGALRRIRATAVDRVELLRGNSGDTGVLSEGLIINMILKEGQSAGGGGTGNFELNQRWSDMGWRDFDGLLSWSSTIGRLSYTVGYEKQLFTPPGNTPSGGQGGDFTRRTRDERYFYPNGVLQQLRPQKWERQHHKNIFTAQGVYNFENGDQLNLNLLYQPHPIKATDVTPFTSFTTAGVQLPGTTLEVHQNKTMRQILEIGGEYEKKIGTGTFNVVAIHNRTPVKTSDFRNRTSSAGVLTEVSKNITKQVTQEDVVRGSYSWPVFKGQTLTLGAEGAKNTLNQNQFAFADLNRDLRQENVARTLAIVEEKRGELFGIHNWTLTPKLSVESSLTYEFSTITTNYPQIPEASYKFLKPRVDVRYSLTSADRLRFKAERTVSQLNFSNFVPVYNAVDSRLDPGNPGIAPEKTWTYEAGIEHRMPNDQGTLEARAFYKNITDHIDRGPFGLPVGGLPSSAPINIDKATNKGVELKAGLRLTRLGLRNVQINSRLQIQDSEVIDPFTGKKRQIYNLWDREFTLGFRHDVTRWKMSYGATMQATGGANITSDIRTLAILKRDPRIGLFVEKALPREMTLRFEMINLTGSHESSYRALYLVSQGSGGVNRTETYQEVRDLRYVLRLRGKF